MAPLRVAATVAVLALLSAVAVSAAADGSDVVVLTDASFDSTIQSSPNGQGWFVKFYAPWCGHCKHMAPTLNEFATAIKGTTNVAKLDCTVHRANCERFGVRGYPTVLFLKDGKYYKYNGARTTDAFTAFVNGGYEDADAQDIPAPAAPAAPAANAPTAGAAATNSEVVEFTSESFAAAIPTASASAPGWLIKFYAPWCGHCKNLAPTFDKLPAALKGMANVGRVDATKYPELGSRFQVKGYPTVVFVKGDQMYEFDGARTEESFVNFVKSGYLQAKATRVPAAGAKAAAEEVADHKDVIVLDDTNFEHQTQASTGATTGDWLVEFYAPWCGHCKQLAPAYGKVATALKGEINVAKIDATASPRTTKRFDIKGYPTVVMLHNGKYYDYGGGRTVEEMTKWAKGGFKVQEEAAKIVPGLLGFWDQQVQDLKDEFVQLQSDLVHLIQFKKNPLIVTFAAGGLVGVVIISILFMCLLGSPRKILEEERAAARQIVAAERASELAAAAAAGAKAGNASAAAPAPAPATPKPAAQKKAD